MKDTELRQRVFYLEERIGILEAIIVEQQEYWKWRIDSIRESKITCSTCMIQPYPGFVCLNNECPHGFNKPENEE
jgi:hypothetical protein